jgi:tetratricopeptide (TPR) repeat protein
MTLLSRIRLFCKMSLPCAAAIWLSAGSGALGQQNSLTTIVGELHAGSAVLWGELTIEVEAGAAGGGASKAYVRSDGSFEVRDVPVGTHKVWVMDERGNAIWHELVPVTPGATRLTIDLDTRRREAMGDDTISIARMRQKRSPIALKELRLAEKASDKGQMRESIQHLRRAVEAAPEMQEARNNLGARLLHLGEYEEAKRELDVAVSLDREAPVPHVNLALTLLALGRSGEAEAEARLALHRDPLSPGANYAAGAALDREGRTDEAVQFLGRATDKVPQALLIEARILASRHELAGAAGKLRLYLSRPGVSQRREVERWLEALTSGRPD